MWSEGLGVGPAALAAESAAKPADLIDAPDIDNAAVDRALAALAARRARRARLTRGDYALNEPSAGQPSPDAQP